eukprot:1447019-Rhodomonas_salina.4
MAVLLRAEIEGPRCCERTVTSRTRRELPTWSAGLRRGCAAVDAGTGRRASTSTRCSALRLNAFSRAPQVSAAPDTPPACSLS